MAILLQLACFVSAVLVVTAVKLRRTGNCPGQQGCGRCLDSGCTDCYTGYYGPNCSLFCSSGCRNNRCRLDPDGSAVCVEGCSPGLYGKQCNMACLSPGETCSKCPSHCNSGFCQLGDRCVSGCKDSYYGTGCFTCRPGCQVCNNITKNCYECGNNCSFSDCLEDVQCQMSTLKSGNVTSIKTTYVSALFYWIGGGSVAVVIFIGLVVYASCRLKRHKAATDFSWRIGRYSSDNNPEVISRNAFLFPLQSGSENGTGSDMRGDEITCYAEDDVYECDDYDFST